MTFLVLYVIAGLVMLAFFLTSSDEISAYMDEVRRRLRVKQEPEGHMSLGASLLLITLGWPYVLGALLLSWWVLRNADFIDKKRAEAVRLHRQNVETMAEIERRRRFENARETAKLVAVYGQDAVAVMMYVQHLDDKAFKQFVDEVQAVEGEDRARVVRQFAAEAHAFVAEMESRG